MTYVIVETMFPGASVKRTELGDEEGYARRRYAQSVESSLMSRLSEVLGVDAMSRRKMFSKSKTTKSRSRMVFLKNTDSSMSRRLLDLNT